MTTVPPIYRSVLLEVERRRVQLGLSQDRLSEISGISDRAFAKALHASTPSGRMATWPTLQFVVDALYPDGCDVIIKAKKGEKLSELSFRYRIRAATAQHDRRVRRELMAALGAKGGHARAQKLSPERRTAIARRAGLARAASRARGPH